MQTARYTDAVPVRSANLSGLAATPASRLLLGVAATALVAAAAHIAIPLPFTPVPLTLQPLAVLGVGMALGPVGGFVAMLAYLAEGALGLPVFSPTGPGGLLQLFGPTGGFLLAYPVVAAIAGGVTRVFARRPLGIRVPAFAAAALAGIAAIVVLFLSGAGWFMHFTQHDLHAVWIGAVAPFLPGETIKILVAAGTYQALTRSGGNLGSAPCP